MASDDSTPTRETFYSNLNGTTTLDIALIASGAPLCVLLRFSVMSALVRGTLVIRTWQNFVVEFLTLVLPCILGVTLLSQQIIPLLVTLSVTLLTLLIIAYRQVISKTTTQNSAKQLSLESIWNMTHRAQKLQFVTVFRVYAMIVTSISILAVDFVAFPRRLAKTDMYGTGLMDLCVGVFTFGNAVVSPEARGTDGTNKCIGVGMRSIWKRTVSIIPILTLGFGRLALVTATNYHVHASEFGVHWNYFFTLAAVSLFSTICLTLVSPHMSGLLSLVLAASYQNQLTNQGLGEFVLHGDDGQDSREGLLNANREGLVSCIGYLVIYQAGIQLGRFLFLPRSHVREWCVLFAVLCTADVILWGMLHVSATSIEPVCRRTANLSYIIWTLANSVHMLACFLFVDLVMTMAKLHFWRVPSKHEQNDSSRDGQPIPASDLISAIDRSQLLFFLLANLLTGLVNKSIGTITYRPVTGLGIITVYMLVLCITAVVMQRYKIRTKCW